MHKGNLFGTTTVNFSTFFSTISILKILWRFVRKIPHCIDINFKCLASEMIRKHLSLSYSPPKIVKCFNSSNENGTLVTVRKTISNAILPDFQIERVLDVHEKVLPVRIPNK